MLIRVAIALIAVLLCFNFPVYYDNQYTELANLRENAYRSVGLVVVMMLLSRSVYAYAISMIEIGLIAANIYIAISWDLRDTIYIATHYTTLQLGAYIAELAIIGIAGIFGAAMVGTDDDNINNRDMPRWFSRPYRIVRR
jgi:uncharacterized protein YjeT (DUF2065 family)